MTENFTYEVIDTDLPEGKNIVYRLVGLQKRNLIIKRVCPNCLHGFQRDVETVYGEYLGDFECGRCDGTGFI